MGTGTGQQPKGSRFSGGRPEPVPIFSQAFSSGKAVDSNSLLLSKKVTPGRNFPRADLQSATLRPRFGEDSVMHGLPEATDFWVGPLIAPRNAPITVRIETEAEPIPGYRLMERLGGGGFGEVWKCVAPGGLLKAIKFVYGELSSANEDDHRAEQELKALSRVKTVRHPYILSLERYEVIDGQLMIVMELADRSLWDRFKECRAQGMPGIPRGELLGYMEEAAEALDLMNIEFQLH